ncbi:hypothetical protein BDF22DRAFT_746733 [Syncephalis plumigaleata]|nr:hypothetical protein BDF22DRAFT_746733 [Syncephalis plumigaleata]
MTNLLSISNTLKSTLTTATIANDIDIDTTTITTAAELTSTPISRATTDTNNAFAIALQQAQIMAVTFAEAAEAVADAVLVATELLHAVDMQDIANIMEMNKAVASSTSFAISAITDALRTANSSCAALSKADMTREFAIATVLNILSQQSTIPQLSTQSPSAPSPSPAPSSSNIVLIKLYLNH